MITDDYFADFPIKDVIFGIKLIIPHGVKVYLPLNYEDCMEIVEEHLEIDPTDMDGMQLYSTDPKRVDCTMKDMDSWNKYNLSDAIGNHYTLQSGKRIYIEKPYENYSEVRVRRVPAKWNQNHMQKIFSAYGTIENIEIERIRPTFHNKLKASYGHLRSGTFRIKMKVERDIPSTLIVDNYKMEIWYPGQMPTCWKCGMDHFKGECKTRYRQYINRFEMGDFDGEFPELPNKNNEQNKSKNDEKSNNDEQGSNDTNQENTVVENTNMENNTGEINTGEENIDQNNNATVPTEDQSKDDDTFEDASDMDHTYHAKQNTHTGEKPINAPKFKFGFFPEENTTVEITNVESTNVDNTIVEEINVENTVENTTVENNTTGEIHTGEIHTGENIQISGPSQFREIVDEIIERYEGEDQDVLNSIIDHVNITQQNANRNENIVDADHTGGNNAIHNKENIVVADHTGGNNAIHTGKKVPLIEVHHAHDSQDVHGAIASPVASDNSETETAEEVEGNPMDWALEVDNSLGNLIATDLMQSTPINEILVEKKRDRDKLTISSSEEESNSMRYSFGSFPNPLNYFTGGKTKKKAKSEPPSDL